MWLGECGRIVPSFVGRFAFFVPFFLLQGFALKGASATNGERLTLTDKERGIIWEAMTPPSPAKKKRRTSLPLPPDRQSQAPATFKKSARLPTNASLAAAAAAKKKNDATQIAIAFESKTKYPVGMKILLSDKIYSSPGQVSRRNSSVAFRILIPFPHVLVLLFSLPGTRAGTWSPVRIRVVEYLLDWGDSEILRKDLQARRSVFPTIQGPGRGGKDCPTIGCLEGRA